MAPVAIALGSNLGDCEAILHAAVRAIERLGQVVAISRFVHSAPMYVTDQPEFLNGVARLETRLAPVQLLTELKRIERELGRQPRTQNGPREIDLDIVLYGSLVYRFNDALTIPHPRAAEREFVLRPLVEIWPGAHLPGFGGAAELLAHLSTA